MNNTELYINGKLVDTGGDLGVRLNRKLIDPGAVNTVDAQYSYTVSLPATQRNTEAFNYATVEETRDKFNRVYKAQLIINSVRIFGPGLFRLTSINEDGIKGQLYLPAKKTVKDIFGELKLNENAPFEIPFLDFSEYVNFYNEAAAAAPQPAVFPFVMYGVLPKVPLNRNSNLYSPRNTWDDSVRIGMSDLPPAVNPLMMLRHFFESRGYSLQGTAFQDAKLAQLYQTYKNAPDYVQPWNYGRHATMRLNGLWSSRNNARTGVSNQYERGVNQSYDDTGNIFSCDLFDATNTLINITEDTGGNVLYNEILDADNRVWVNCQMRVPVAGFYKIQLQSSIKVDDSENWRATDPVTGVQHIGGRTTNATNSFVFNQYGMRLIRDKGAGDFGLSGAKLAGTFYYDNQPQNDTFDRDNIPKYFPQVSANGQLNFVDPAHDGNVLLGFEYGRQENGTGNYVNPKDTANRLAQIVAAKPAISWNTAEASDTPTRLAIQSPGWWKFGRVGNFDDPGENPNADIDYSGGARVVAMRLDAYGNPTINGDGSEVVLHRFSLDRYFTYVLTLPAGTDMGVYGKVFIHNGSFNTLPVFEVDFVDGVATFDTGAYALQNFAPMLTVYLAGPGFDVDEGLVISKRIDAGSEEVIDWELSNRYAINLQNAPLNYARRGQYNGASAPADWNAQGSAAAVVWLEAGELLTLASVSSEGRYRRDGMHSTFGMVSHQISFNLSVEPFRVDPEWLKVDLRGNGTGAMNWNDPINFGTDTIDLVKFLDASVKTDDYIENFCKAYNLALTQVDAQTFSLDVKQSKTGTSTRYIDMDKAASVKRRENTPLGLPSRYVLGFTIDTEEQGFAETGETGGGTFETGATEENVITQTSAFSYTWYKELTKVEPGGNLKIRVPIVSKADAWAITMSYPEAMRKRYTDLAARFMYYNGILPGTYRFNGAPLKIAQMSNELTGSSVLSYRNAIHTILNNYFTLLINGASHYTNIQAHINPAEYVQLDGSISVKFNGDLYYVAEISGYDPYNRNEAKIKLIRRI